MSRKVGVACVDQVAPTGSGVIPNTSYFTGVYLMLFDLFVTFVTETKTSWPITLLMYVFFMLYVLIGHYRLPADIFSDYMVSIHF